MDDRPVGRGKGIGQRLWRRGEVVEKRRRRVEGEVIGGEKEVIRIIRGQWGGLKAGGEGEMSSGVEERLVGTGRSQW